ncbi:MAG: asparagine synthetase B [Fimbriimonadia bacterium]
MSGIVCTISVGDAKSVSKMLSRIRHRGPDGSSVLQQARMIIGQRISSVLDRRRTAAPIVSADGKRMVAFTGRLFNGEQLRRKLGSPWETDSDTETLIRLFEVKGVDCVNELDGQFAFVMADGEHFFVARDPIGVKPLYYATRDEGRIFASELKAFGKMCTDFREFPPGCYFHSKLGTGRFYQLPVPQGRDMSIGQAALRIRLEVETAVGKRDFSDQPVGVFLSGGLDSCILAWVMRQAHGKVDTFSVGMRGSHVSRAATEAAEELDTDHRHRTIRSDEVIEVLPRVIYLLESFDAQTVRSAVCNHFLAEEACKHVSSVLSGDGADEIFGGYERLRELPPSERSVVMWRLTSGLHNTVLQRMDRMTAAHGLETRVPFLDRRVVALAFSIPDWMKAGANGETKWILRHAYGDVLPNRILRQPRAPMDAAAGVAAVLKGYAEKEISDREFDEERMIPWADPLRNKEEVLYYRIWRRSFVPEMAKLVGRTIET